MRTLLRAILREHKHMPPELRRLGNAYALKEFRDMRKVTDPSPKQMSNFRNAWLAYLDQIRTQRLNKQEFGMDIDPQLIDRLSDEQRMKLLDMRASAVPSEEGAEDRPPSNMQ